MERWMTCDQLGSGKDKPCLINEQTVLTRFGDPPRCIRHGALLFGDSTLDGLTHQQASSKVRKRHEGNDQ